VISSLLCAPINNILSSHALEPPKVSRLLVWVTYSGLAVHEPAATNLQILVAEFWRDKSVVVISQLEQERAMDTEAAKWIKLAAYARDIANEMRDPTSQKAMQEIADRYDAIARRAIRIG
jgi:hypothetical protein